MTPAAAFKELDLPYELSDQQIENEDSIQDIEKYNMIKQGLSNYIKPENQKKFRRKNIQKREQKLIAK